MKKYTFFAYPTYSAIERYVTIKIIIDGCDNIVSAMEKSIVELEKYQEENNIPENIRCWFSGEGSFEQVIMYNDVTGERVCNLSYSEMRTIESAIRTLNEFKTKM